MRYLEAQTQAANQIACAMAQGKAGEVLASYAANVVACYNDKLWFAGRQRDLTEGHTTRLAQIILRDKAFRYKGF